MIDNAFELKKYNLVKISKFHMYELLRNRFYVRSADLQM